MFYGLVVLLFVFVPEWCLMCVTCVVYDMMSCVFVVVLLWLFSVVVVCVCVRVFV